MSLTPRDDHGRDLTLEYRPFSLALKQPLSTAHGSIRTRDGFLVRITDADGTVGYGEASPLPGWTESAANCETALDRAREAFRNGGTHAALKTVDRSVAGRHAVTLALADLEATREATTLYRYLGNGPLVARVPVNATIGDADPMETARRAREAVDRGFDVCKVKVGRRSVAEDLDRLRQVRETIGPGPAIRVDANEAWTYDEAETALSTCADLDVSMLEQPLPAGALEGHAALRGNGVAIALDEGILEHGVDAICDAKAADAVVLKPMALGGIDIARQVAAWLTELGITPLVTTTIDAVVARTAAVHLAAAIPDIPACGLATADFLAEDLGRDPVLLDNGSAVVPQAKGLGVEEVWTE